MKMRRFRSMMTICLIFVLFAAMGSTAFATDSSSTNKFNVVVLLDASGSMASTDPQNYRFEAISQFINLLTETGNNVGAVVFSGDVSASQGVIPMNSQQVFLLWERNRSYLFPMKRKYSE